MDVKTTFAQAMRERPNLSLAEFTTWSKFIEFNAFHPATGASSRQSRTASFGFMRSNPMVAKSENMYFLKVDRSTETLDRPVNGTLCYLQFYKRGGLAERFGST
jgi:hypothetical protein